MRARVSSVTSVLDTFKEVATFTPEAFGRFGRHVKDEWIVQALVEAKGDAKLRRRKLPVERTLWLVIGMGLFRDRSIHEVAERLELTLPGKDGEVGIAGSAIPRARERLGAEAVERVFEITAAHWMQASAEAHTWRGLTLLGIDGSHLRIPDTPENEAAFGRPGSGRSGSGYPQVRLVGLFGLRSRVLGAMTVGEYRTSEQTLVEPLWDKVPNHSLTFLDRGFLSWWPLWRLQMTGVERHWVVRAKSNVKIRTIQKLGRGDELGEIEVPRALRATHPEMPEVMRVRRITCLVKGYRPYTILTSALEADRYPGSELARMYHERWECELAYDEIKTHLLNRQEALRSKTPDGIRQEIAGLGIAYNLVRLEMAEVAAQLKVLPTRISFLHTLHSIRDFLAWSWITSPGALPKRVESHDRKVRLYLLPERRTTRRNPRHVKIKMSNYPRNRGRTGPLLK